MAKKKYVVRLTEDERTQLQEVIRKLSGTSTKVRRAHILLKADANGPNWTDKQIADAFGCRIQTVENVRLRLVTLGFSAALEKKQPEKPPRAKLLDGQQEAKIIALRLGQPPAGFANWSLRLLANKVVELGIVEQISHETLRQMLKKTG
jgi:hypothetical protein